MGKKKRRKLPCWKPPRRCWMKAARGLPRPEMEQRLSKKNLKMQSRPWQHYSPLPRKQGLKILSKHKHLRNPKGQLLRVLQKSLWKRRGKMKRLRRKRKRSKRKKSKRKDFPGRSSGRRKTTKENSEKMNVGRSGRERWRKT